MKGKRYSVEDKIRLSRATDSGRSIGEVIREGDISEVTFHRWKKQFGQMEVNEAKWMKKLERENTELKKMLAESLLKNRVLEFICEKSCEPRNIGEQWRGKPLRRRCAPGERRAGS